LGALLLLLKAIERRGVRQAIGGLAMSDSFMSLMGSFVLTPSRSAACS
jgi:hypothetical protein